MTKKAKSFIEYIDSDPDYHISYNGYFDRPAVEFLKYVVDAHDSIAYCRKNFTKNKDSETNLRHLSSAILPTIMGHFETYQKALWALMFENSRHFDKFDLKAMFKALNDFTSPSIDLFRASAYRGTPSSIGLLIADSLTGWHDPEKVNLLFNSFGLKHQLYSNEQINSLKILWQFRHSIVHTGGWLTKPDSQKASELIMFSDQPLIFKETFIQELCRKMHILVYVSIKGIEKVYIPKISSELHPVIKSMILKIFDVKSKYKSWFPK